MKHIARLGQKLFQRVVKQDAFAEYGLFPLGVAVVDARAVTHPDGRCRVFVSFKHLIAKHLKASSPNAHPSKPQRIRPLRASRRFIIRSVPGSRTSTTADRRPMADQPKFLSDAF